VDREVALIKQEQAENPRAERQALMTHREPIYRDGSRNIAQSRSSDQSQINDPQRLSCHIMVRMS